VVLLSMTASATAHVTHPRSEPSADD
jgi:hypothetical protein